MFLCIRPSVSQLKKSWCFIYIYIYIYIEKNNVLACILALITSLLKSREHGQNFKKTTKILFCLSFSIRGTNLHVKHIPDIKTIVLL